jgi:hypothetical protein
MYLPFLRLFHLFLYMCVWMCERACCVCVCVCVRVYLPFLTLSAYLYIYSILSSAWHTHTNTMAHTHKPFIEIDIISVPVSVSVYLFPLSSRFLSFCITVCCSRVCACVRGVRWKSANSSRICATCMSCCCIILSIDASCVKVCECHGVCG